MGLVVDSHCKDPHSDVSNLNFRKLAEMARLLSLGLVINSKVTMDLRDSSGDEDPTLANEIRNVSPNDGGQQSRHRPTGQVLDALLMP